MTTNQDGEQMRDRKPGAEASTPYEQDIADQSRALTRFIDAESPGLALRRPIGGYERIVVTGMGSSHYAGARTWRRLVLAGLPAWWIDTAALLDSPALVTADTLLIATSQSGASGETVALFESLASRGVRPETIGVTNDAFSPLGQAATHPILLHSGDEATVSTKSYVNSLAAHEYLSEALLESESPVLWESLREGVVALDAGTTVAPEIIKLAAAPAARIALIGAGDQVATALFGSLILKEAAKVPAEGFLAGNFRHGPLEIAGPGLVAIVFGVEPGDRDLSLRRLAADIAATGANVITFGTATLAGCEPAETIAHDGFAGLVAGADLCHWLCVRIARDRGLTPGEFQFGQKVTGL